jgi:hypothetical protein
MPVDVMLRSVNMMSMKNAVVWDAMPCGASKNRRYVSEGRIASIIRVTGIDELGTTLAVNINQRTLRRNAMSPA